MQRAIEIRNSADEPTPPRLKLPHTQLAQSRTRH
jgi:hypothetical protein